MKFLKYVSLMFVLFGTAQAQQKIKIHKAYHHKGSITDKIVFYFSHNPICNYIPNKANDNAMGNTAGITPNKDGVVELEFFMPLTHATKEANRFIAQMNATLDDSSDLYRMHMKYDHAKNGIRCLVAFKPEEVGFQQESFQAITGHPALSFSFIKRKAMDALNAKMRPLLRSAQLKKKARIAIDCGHGDKDPGFVTGTVKEKDINLQIGLKTAKLLKQKGYDVFLTRNGDTYLSLDARTTETNKQKNVDLFVSIHTNATHHKHVSGIETFCVQPKLFAKELDMMDKHAGDRIAHYKHTLYKQSRLLAEAVQSQVLSAAKTINSKVVDRKVKYKPAQVLVGTEAPSILVELGFLSHAKEGRLLQTEKYQKALASGIYRGIKKFLG